ncbi:hypothetical protein AQAU111925_10585 [Aquirufa aurantiipilula]
MTPPTGAVVVPPVVKYVKFTTVLDPPPVVPEKLQFEPPPVHTVSNRKLLPDIFAPLMVTLFDEIVAGQMVCVTKAASSICKVFP